MLHKHCVHAPGRHISVLGGRQDWAKMAACHGLWYGLYATSGQYLHRVVWRGSALGLSVHPATGSLLVCWFAAVN